MAEYDDGNQGKHSEQPIIIKKIKKGGHAHHGGAWKVAYADFVTALMAFFIVMWILASSAEIKEAVAAYFNSPEDYNIFTGVKTAPVTVFDNPAAMTGKDGTGKGDNKWNISTSKTDTLLMSDSAYKEAQKDSAMSADIIDKAGEELKKQFEEMQKAASTTEMQNILSNVEIQVTDEGLKIELLETHDNTFFEIGSAKLKPNAIIILKQLAAKLGRLGNVIEIEGHTDSRGYSNNAKYTNWELSADRANAARRVMQANGLWPGQITSVTGYADTHPKNPKNTFDAVNRRIGILVKKLSVNNFISAGNGEKK